MLRSPHFVGRKGFGPTYVAHIPPLEGWYSRDSLCYGVGARVAYITAKAKRQKKLEFIFILASTELIL